jgi:hypothetical protein
VLIVHNSGACRTELTLARCRVLSAWRTSEVSNGSSLKSPIASTGVSGPCTSRTR